MDFIGFTETKGSVREASGLIVTDNPRTSIALWRSIGVSGGYTVDAINGGKTVKVYTTIA